MKVVKETKAQARHPLQLSVLGWWIFACVGQFIFGAPPGSISFDPITQSILLVLLFVSSIVCLTGSLIRDVPLGFALEKWGWIGVCLLFTLCDIYITIEGESVPIQIAASVFPAFTLGGGWRAVKIHQAQKRLRQIVDGEVEPLP